MFRKKAQVPARAVACADPIPLLGPILAVFACGASSAVWLWFTSPKPLYLPYFLNFAVPACVLFFGGLGHLVLEEFRATAAVFNFRRHVPLLRSKYYAVAVFFTAVAMISIFFQVPLHVRFALSRPAMDAFVADVQENPDAVRPATMRVGGYVIQTAPARHLRRDGALMFYLPGVKETGFTYSKTPIIGYAGGNPGASGSLGGGWYWFSDE
jgi:hypothetical protein